MHRGTMRPLAGRDAEQVGVVNRGACMVALIAVSDNLG